MTKFQLELRAILDRPIPANVLAQANRRRKRRKLMPLFRGMTYRDAVEQTTAELEYGGKLCRKPEVQ